MIHPTAATLAVLLVATAAVVLALALHARAQARRWAALARAAERIARGQLAGGLPVADDGPTGRIANALDDLRRRLSDLTSNLAHRQAEAEAIIESVAEGVFAVDRERRIRYLNPQAERMLGAAADGAIGRFCGDVLRPRGPGGVAPCDEHCPIVHARFRGGARATEHIAGPEGAGRTVVISSAPLAGDLQVQVVREETESEATRRMRDAVLANISHEFRTPLSAQLASIELLLDRMAELEPDEARALVLALQRGTLRLTQLIDNLLESVRIEAGEARLRRRPVALDEVVEEAVELTRPLFAQRAQAIDVDLPHPLPPLEGDAPRLVQVFVNLLANAAKFGPEKSCVRVGGAVRDDAREVVVWVEDEGPGLPELPEDAPFTRFWRAAGDEPEQGGAGLGLFIVKSIVERHGGRVRAESGDAGTRMCIILPTMAEGRR